MYPTCTRRLSLGATFIRFSEANEKGSDAWPRSVHQVAVRARRGRVSRSSAPPPSQRRAPPPLPPLRLSKLFIAVLRTLYSKRGLEHTTRAAGKVRRFSFIYNARLVSVLLLPRLHPFPRPCAPFGGEKIQVAPRADVDEIYGRFTNARET